MLFALARGLSYSCFMIGSAVIIANPEAPLRTVLGTGPGLLNTLPPDTISYVPLGWAVLFGISAMACLLGVLTRTWVGEFVGGLPLVFCFLALGTAFFIVPNVFSGAICFGIGTLMMARWLMVVRDRAFSLQRQRDYHRWRTAVTAVSPSKYFEDVYSRYDKEKTPDDPDTRN